MSREEPYRLTSPCANCPFRKDIKPYLNKARVQGLQEDLVQSEFYCHKTVDYSQPDAYVDEDGDPVDGVADDNTAHCAGALILLEKMNRPSQMMRIAERLRLYDRRKLNMTAPVFDTWDEMIQAQEG